MSDSVSNSRYEITFFWDPDPFTPLSFLSVPSHSSVISHHDDSPGDEVSMSVGGPVPSVEVHSTSSCNGKSCQGVTLLMSS